MFYNVIATLLLLAIIIPVGVFFIGERKVKRFKSSLAVNVISFFGILLFAVVFVSTGHAQAADAAAVASESGMKFLSAALSVGLACIGSGIAVSSAASAALGALSENEALMGKALIFVALAEGIAIYGLVISFIILGS